MNIFILISCYLLMEISINSLFHFVSRKLNSNENRKRSVFKGILEKLLLTIGPYAGFPQVIIAFGAIKIGTRFQSNSKVSNDYFIIGNFISLLAAILFIQLVN